MDTFGGGGISTIPRSLKIFTHSLVELKEWLIEKGVTDVDTESAETYWKPMIDEMYGEDLRIWIVNAYLISSMSFKHSKGVDGVG